MITYPELNKYHVNSLSNICHIIFNDKYNDNTKNFARSVLNYLYEKEYVSIKQIKAVERIVFNKN